MDESIGPIFISYAHQGRGKDYIQLFKEVANIAGLQNDLWTDKGEIEAGDEWQGKIEDGLHNASAAILLIDWKFLSSNYIGTKEVASIYAKALGIDDSNGADLNTVIFPILVETCPFELQWEWLRKLQLEPEYSLRNVIDPKKHTHQDLLTLSDLDETQIAKLKTAMVKRLGSRASFKQLRPKNRRQSDPKPASQRTNLAPHLTDTRYLISGEDLRGDYVVMQLNLSHAEYQTYRVEVKYAFREGLDSGFSNWYGLARMPLISDEMIQYSNASLAHPGDAVLYASLSDIFEYARDRTVQQCLAEAQQKAAELNIPLQFHIGISANAGELIDIPWETLPLDAGILVADTKRTLFSRSSISSGIEAVESQTRAKQSLRGLSIFSDVGIGSAEGGDPGKHEQCQKLMRSSLEPLTSQGSDICSLLRPNPDDLLEQLSNDASIDVLYIACEAVKRDDEYYLKLPNRELSRAELIRHFRLAPVPRLVILVPSSLLTGSPINDESLRAINHFAPLFTQLGAGFALSCQQKMTTEDWQVFLDSFVSELNKHGHVTGAIAKAREESLDEDNLWKPVLVTRVKSTRLWYKPGFVYERPEDNWRSLVESIKNKRFCPVVGPGVHYRLQQNRMELARQLADEYGFPLSFSHRINLPEVLQYVRTIESNKRNFLAKLEDRIRERLKTYTISSGAPADSGQTLYDQAYETANAILSAEPDNPYNILARLPVNLYLTTNLDPFLETALNLIINNAGTTGVSKIEKVHVLDFAQVDTESQSKDGSTSLPFSEFSSKHPLVFHLFGSYESLNKACIAEDDYYEFLATFYQRMKDIEGPIEGRLGDADLVFLGFKWSSLGFRILFRALQKYVKTRPDDSFHVAVQIDPDDDEIVNPDKALEYLRRYFGSVGGGKHLQQAKISIYWGSTGDFLMELEQYLR